MKKPRRELVGYYKGKAGRSGSIRIALNAKPTKASERIGRMSTRKTSVYHTGPPFETVYYSMIAYRKERAELYWRYRAQKVIIQNLLHALTVRGWQISGPLTATTWSFTKSNFLNEAKSKAPTISETGQTKIFPKSSGFKWHVDSMFKEEPNKPILKSERHLVKPERVIKEGAWSIKPKRKKRALKFAPGHGLTFQDSLDIR